MITDDKHTSDKHTSFVCPHCGQTGEVVWNGEKEARAPVRLSSGFHMEEGRLSGTERVIICDVCDEIDPHRF